MSKRQVVLTREEKAHIRWWFRRGFFVEVGIPKGRKAAHRRYHAELQAKREG